MNASRFAIMAAIGGGLLSSPAYAVTCTTSTPVNSAIYTDAAGVVTSGGTYNATGTADCPDQPGPAGPQGAKGDKGNTGATGAQGPKGDKGDTGADGATGATGETGAQGAAGADGATGAQGVKGDKGDKGDKGNTGAQGAAGAKGDKGDKGDQGIAGLNGKDFDPADLERGLATAAALNVPHVDPNKRFGVSGSAGFYNSEAAIGFGAALRLDDTWQLGGSVASDVDGKNVAGKAVVTGQW